MVIKLDLLANFNHIWVIPKSFMPFTKSSSSIHDDPMNPTELNWSSQPKILIGKIRFQLDQVWIE